jgi:hypothetical protein
LIDHKLGPYFTVQQFRELIQTDATFKSLDTVGVVRDSALISH